MIRVMAEHHLTEGPHRAILSADERHHLRVRRVEPGTSVEVLDGVGHIGHGVLEPDDSVQVSDVRLVDPLEPVSLLVGAGDKERFGWLVEKAVEIGVTEIVPVETERSRQVATRVRPSHVDKLIRRADEGLKQCGGAWRTTVRAPVALTDALESCAARTRWLADPDGALLEDLSPESSIAVLVGPEGGLTEHERRQAERAGFRATRLGMRTMRFETAALAAGLIARLKGHER